MLPTLTLLFLIFAFCPFLLPAQTPDLSPANSASTPDLETRHVEAWLRPVPDLGDALEGRALSTSPAPNLGAQLESLPGLQLDRRGSDTLDPQIRGLGFGHVSLSLGGLPLAHGSPTRTASPVNSLPPEAFRLLEIDASLPSVTHGPAVLGGHLLAQPAWPDPSYSENQYTGQAALTWDPSRDGYGATLQATAAGPRLAVAASFAQQDREAWEDGDGRTVPAAYEARSGSLLASFLPAPGHTFRAGYLLHQTLLAENLALPLDIQDARLQAGLLEYDCAPPGSSLRADFAFRLADSLHTLDNSRRAAPSPVAARADSRTLHLQASLRPAGGSERPPWRLGIEYLDTSESARRARGSAVDILWPALDRADFGLFAESYFELASSRLRLGARLDHARATADLTGTAFGQPIADLFVRYNGPAADRSRQDDWTGALNLLLEHPLNPVDTPYAGLGYTRQAPATTERYRVFLNALGGGFEIGNPLLPPTSKVEAVLGWRHLGPRWRFHLEGFAAALEDFPYRLQVGLTAPPPPPPPGQWVYGYRPTPVFQSGLELSGAFRPVAPWSLPFAFSWVRLDHRDHHHDLPDSPPWTAQLGLQRDLPKPLPAGHALFHLRAFGAKSNQAPQDDPLYGSTDAAALLDFLLHLRLSSRLTLDLRADNLLNTAATHYLAPPVSSPPPPGGSLLPGDRLPLPGRAFALTATYAW